MIGNWKKFVTGNNIFRLLNLKENITLIEFDSIKRTYKN